MKKIIFFFIAMFSLSHIGAQTANVTLGCVPLEVDFTSPDMDTYFWVFDNGNTSILQNPSANYVDPGIYTAELFESNGGTKVGEIVITVLAKPEIMISASEQNGCSPFQVSFTNESILDTNAQVSGYLWDFGDGVNSTQENPTHTYDSIGVFSVSLRIESDLVNCDETVIFDDFITVSGNVDAGFSIDNTIICDAPATFNLTNNTIDQSNYTYLWDFDNGETSTEYNPPAPTYTEDGSYTIVLMIDNGDGCVVTLSRTVIVGKPNIEISFPDTVCLGLPVLINNNSNANNFSWTFGNNANPETSNFKEPSVTFNQAGSQIVTFSAIASPMCQADTFFTVFVEDPKAAFTIDPVILCTDPATYTFSHPQSGLANYTWYIKELDTFLLGGPDYNFVYDEPFRDSFYISRKDTFTVYLSIQTNAGCFAVDSLEFYHRAPEAHFIPSITRGCAPLTVNFDELSLSTENITSWDWVFGDGTSANTNMADDMTHTYNEPGEYYVQLAIENEVGCKDTSAGVMIYVGEQITSDFTFDQTEICLYDTVNFEALNLDPRIDSWHFDTDEGRIGDCYETSDASHAFVHAPGTYNVSLDIEYNGCYNKINNGQTITVNGSKSRIKFKTNCIDPYTVMFQDSSLNASTSIWYINGDTINMDTITGDVFNYTFDSTGDYTIKLWTDDDTFCDADSSTVNVYIRDIEANFDLPEHVCAYSPINIDASSSIDVDDTCSKGYEWFGIARRPRQVDTTVVQGSWLPGPFSVRLIVEDLNGCKDTLDKNSEAFDMQANFDPNRDKMCYPSTISFLDLSISDTTIVDWSWDFGSNDQNPTDVLFATGPTSFLPVQLVTTDAIGCMDTITKNIVVYEPTTSIGFEPDNTVCIGSTIDFTATDFTQEGSFLNFNWLFGNMGSMGSSMEQNPSLVVTEAGISPILLIIEEDSTGCTTEIDLTIEGIIPSVAQFAIEAEDPEKICPQEIVLFNNQSTVYGDVTYFWDFGNGNTSSAESPTSFFDVGTFDITLTVNSLPGCSDSYTEQITLEGPQGDIAVDKDVICLGDEITFEAVGLDNVNYFEWDLGDGTAIQNENTVQHTYTTLHDSLGATITVSIILESDNGCTVEVVKEINLSDLEADFNIIMDTVNICNREVQFVNNSFGGDTYTWDFGNGESSSEEDPFITYTESDTFAVTLLLESEGSSCNSKQTQEVIISALDKVQVPTIISPNNDDINDYFDVIIAEDQRGCVEVVRSKIFNRWGNKVYDNDLPAEGWDGVKSNGDIAPAEIYTYLLEVLYTTGETEFFKGTFTLIR